MPDLSWKPYFYSAAEGKSEPGFAKEMLLHCFKKLEVNSKAIPSSIKRVEHLLKYGKADLWVMSYRQGREEWLEYGKIPLFVDGYAMFVHKNSLKSVSNLGDLNGLKVGTLLGLHVSKPYKEWHEQLEEHAKPLTFTSEEQLLKKLLTREIDVAITSVIPFLAYAELYSFTDDIQISGKPLRERNYYVVLSKNGKNISDQKLFLDKIDNCLIGLKNSPTMNNIRARYFSN